MKLIMIMYKNEKPKDIATNEEMNILLVVATQDVLESQYQKILREQLKTSSSNKEVSTLLVVATIDKKSISKHAEIEISGIYIKL